jgi:hypothetical protein
MILAGVDEHMIGRTVERCHDARQADDFGTRPDNRHHFEARSAQSGSG